MSEGRGFVRENKCPSGKTEISRQNSYDYFMKFSNNEDEITLKSKKWFSNPPYCFGKIGGQNDR